MSALSSVQAHKENNQKNIIRIYHESFLEK